MESKGLTTKVGLFVAVGILLIFGVVFMLGQERSLFEPTARLYIAFSDVGGLKPGAQVRLAGVNIGTVGSIEFSPILDDKKLHVEIHVRTKMLERIRKDSVATIGTKGLLGDKVIEITIGNQSSDPINEGSFLASQEPPDLFQILEKGQALISNGADVAYGLKNVINKLTDEENVQNVKGIVSSVNNVLNEIETGDGVVHGLIYDRKVQQDLKGTMSNIRLASAGLNRSIAHVEKVVEEIRTGKGTIHGLIYDEDGKQIVENLRRATATIAEVVDAIKTQKGMLHTLIYEEDKGNIIRNLNEATDDLRKLTQYIQSGQGTVGMLIKDPTLFEDLKMILSDLKRNKALKTLIRMSLESEEREKLDEAKISPPPQPPEEVEPASE